MAPSATETPVVPILEKGQEQVKQAASKISAPFVTSKKTLGDDGSAVPTDEALPEVLTDHREPLKLSGALDKYEHFDVTPIIGREFPNTSLVELLRAPNSDELIRDLAITSKS